MFINIRFWFHSFTSDFISYKFTFASRALWNSFLEAVFRAYIPALVAVSNNYFPYLSDIFLANYKIPYPLTYFLVLASIE